MEEAPGKQGSCHFKESIENFKNTSLGLNTWRTVHILEENNKSLTILPRVLLVFQLEEHDEGTFDKKGVMGCIYAGTKS